MGCNTIEVLTMSKWEIAHQNPLRKTEVQTQQVIYHQNLGKI